MSCIRLICLVALFCVVHSQEKVVINWQNVLKNTTYMQFGVADNNIDSPSVTENTQYRSTLKSLNIKFFRFHSESLANEWTSAETKTWNTTTIAAQFDNIAEVFGDDMPTIIMTVPTWPTWMCAEPLLNSSLYETYAQFVADLVKILNIEQGRNVKYWEPFNELDINYGRAGQISDIYTLYNLTSHAMMTVDPTIEVGGPTWSWADYESTPTFLKSAGPYVTFVSWHTYIEGATSVGKSDFQVLNDTLLYASVISDMQAAVQSTRPGVMLFMDEYNAFYNWNIPDPRMWTAMGAVWMASLHRIIAESGLDGATVWDAREPAFGILAPNNSLRYTAYIFNWSNSYFIGSLVSAASSNYSLEVMAVYNDVGASVYLINKEMVPLNVVVAQVGNQLGSGELVLNKINATGPYEGLSLEVAELSQGITIEAESVWCLHNSFSKRK